jgi:hypothetical protein
LWESGKLGAPILAFAVSLNLIEDALVRAFAKNTIETCSNFLIVACVKRRFGLRRDIAGVLHGYIKAIFRAASTLP